MPANITTTPSNAANALYTAARLIRLQNDLGTRLLTMTPDEQAAFVDDLNAAYPNRVNIGQLLLDAYTDGRVELTRLGKDEAYGEYNVLLDGIRMLPADAEGLNRLKSSLAYFSTLYALERARLFTQMQTLPPTSHKIITGCILFHERLYSHAFVDQQGEYAV